MKKIKLIALGGTISAKGMNRLDLKDYVSGKVNPAQFISDLPEINSFAEITVDAYDNISSTDIQISHWIELREKIIKSFQEENYDGIVVTQGTNTIEETAYFLHLTVPTSLPIVITGSQRPYTAISTDAHLNIYHAIKVACSEEAKGKGVLVMLNDEISSARDVSKTNTYRLEAFQSGQLGYIGFVEPDRTIQFYREPTRLHTYQSKFSKLSFAKELPRIEILYSYAGTTGDLIKYIANSGKYDGIVMAGTGAGLVSSKEEEALNDAVKKGLAIVRSSRVGNGRVVAIERYQHLNLVHGDNLSPQKARILLMLSLYAKDSLSEIQENFNKY